MMTADDMANDAAMAESPLRRLCLNLAADVIELTLAGATAEEIKEHIEAVVVAAEICITADAALIGATAMGHA